MTTVANPANDEARRQEFLSRAFYLVGDMLGGVDSQPRMEPGWTGGRLLGPRGSNADVGIGNGGEVFIRGQAGQIGTTDAPASSPVSALLGSPLLLVGAGVVLWLLLRK